ncbi:YitT family protein [Paenibacillus alginolyticus]|uniref:YitT family protein n=1 Tax=Paenibacillus alginolyticus TaxID=59839 RepID=UPI002DBEC8DF|nr:YitT family protein [Paenibacillus alginolyticus]
MNAIWPHGRNHLRLGNISPNVVFTTPIVKFLAQTGPNTRSIRFWEFIYKRIGVTVGKGLGIVFRFGGTSDGIDIIARLCNKYMRWTIGRTVFLADYFIIVLSLVYLDITRAMYTLVTVFIGAKVIDLIQEEHMPRRRSR